MVDQNKKEIQSENFRKNFHFRIQNAQFSEDVEEVLEEVMKKADLPESLHQQIAAFVDAVWVEKSNYLITNLAD